MPTEDGPFTDRFISIMMFPLRCSAVSGLPNRKTISVGSAARIRFKSVCSVHVFRCTRTDSASITVPSSIAAQSKILYKNKKGAVAKSSRICSSHINLMSVLHASSIALLEKIPRMFAYVTIENITSGSIFLHRLR